MCALQVLLLLLLLLVVVFQSQGGASFSFDIYTIMFRNKCDSKANGNTIKSG